MSVISIEHLSKSFLVGHRSVQRERYIALRDVIGREAKNFARKAVDLVRGRQIVQGDDIEEFWALKDVSFEVQQGEVLGIIGRNGAGKSTLLKILSRITEPTAGRVKIRGRVASLLEVGTGFHPELTGRENIYLNGSILGMTRREIGQKFDEIVAFAEVERFLDTPVKHFSSGMYMRLAFAVAAHLEPEILIVDEVLAVGDADFQKKCLGKMHDVASNDGRTVLFVSHNMDAIRNLCSRALLLNNGALDFDGQPDDCFHRYMHNQHRATVNNWSRTSHSVQPTFAFDHIGIRLLGHQPNYILQIDCSLIGQPHHRPAMAAFDISNALGATLMQALPKASPFITITNNKCDLRFDIALPPLVPGEYWISGWVGPSYTETFDICRECVSFEITESPTPGRVFPHTPEHGFLVPSCGYERLG